MARLPLPWSCPGLGCYFPHTHLTHTWCPACFFAPQGGVAVGAYILGRQAFDMLVGTVQTALFLGWLYVLVFPEIPAHSYFTTLLAVAW